MDNIEFDIENSFGCSQVEIQQARTLVRAAMTNEQIRPFIKGRDIVKVIVVLGELVNIVTKERPNSSIKRKD